MILQVCVVLCVEVALIVFSGVLYVLKWCARCSVC